MCKKHLASRSTPFNGKNFPPAGQKKNTSNQTGPHSGVCWTLGRGVSRGRNPRTARPTSRPLRLPTRTGELSSIIGISINNGPLPRLGARRQRLGGGDLPQRPCNGIEVDAASGVHKDEVFLSELSTPRTSFPSINRATVFYIARRFVVARTATARFTNAFFHIKRGWPVANRFFESLFFSSQFLD